MDGAARIARVAGIDIKVHATFLLVVLFGAWQWSGSGPRGALFGAVLVLALFACVVLHELGHSLVARAFGVEVREIVLLPIGGVARLARRPSAPWQELLMALAGPAVNVVLAALLVGGAWLAGGLEAVFEAWRALSRGDAVPSPAAFTALLVSSNVLLVAFNLLPAFPMDGGRALRALLAMPFGVPAATRAAVVLGRVVAAGMLVVGLLGSPMLVLIALFVFLAGGAELRDAQLEAALEGLVARDAVNPYLPRFSPAATVDEAVRVLIFSPAPAFAVEHAGRLVGVVGREALLAAAREGPDGYLAGLADRAPPTTGPQVPLGELRAAMLDAGKPYAAVVQDGLFLGLVTDEDIARRASFVLGARARAGPARPRTAWR